MSQYLEAMAIGDAIDVRGPSGLLSAMEQVRERGENDGIVKPHLASFIMRGARCHSI